LRLTNRELLGQLLLAALILIGIAKADAAFAVEADYTLNPGDVLQVTVWKEDTLDRETLVLPDGSISFPLVGSIMAKGKTLTQLTKDISEKLHPYLPDSPVTLTVKAALGYAVDVIGQVNKPGELIVGHKVTVMQVLSMAGGLTPYASQKDIIILRQEDSGEKSIPFPYGEVVRGRKLESDIFLVPGDVVVVPAASLF
jgi:polysaccharide biosynthesis/export protein